MAAEGALLASHVVQPHQSPHELTTGSMNCRAQQHNTWARLMLGGWIAEHCTWAWHEEEVRAVGAACANMAIRMGARRPVSNPLQLWHRVRRVHAQALHPNRPFFPRTSASNQRVYRRHTSLPDLPHASQRGAPHHSAEPSLDLHRVVLSDDDNAENKIARRLCLGPGSLPSTPPTVAAAAACHQRLRRPTRGRGSARRQGSREELGLTGGEGGVSRWRGRGAREHGNNYGRWPGGDATGAKALAKPGPRKTSPHLVSRGPGYDL
jgi:hypothetical protein